jgi:hypothetical protein
MISRSFYCSAILLLAAFYAGEWVVENLVIVPDPQSSESNGVATLRSNNDALPTTQSDSVGPTLQPVILGLSWKEKMLSFFSSKECIRASPIVQAPHMLEQMFILLGVQKGGTKAIHTFLQKHPDFVSRCSNKSHTTELFFFNNLSLMTAPIINQTEQQIQYANHIQARCPVATESLLNDTRKMYLDDTPLYIQDSDSIPQLLNCVMPKAKLMAVLRNPTDRAFSHYNFYLDYGDCREKPFDEWVDINIKALVDLGVVNATDPYEELLAWQRYNQDTFIKRNRRCETFVARGLYVIQLLHYMTALEASGRPLSDIHVVHSQDLQGDQRQVVYEEILNFLGLANHTLEYTGSVHKTTYQTSMNETTRVKLDNFFQPYNQRLYELLHWNPIWN